MGFILGALVFLLAKVFLPPFLIYLMIVLLIAISVIYIISVILDRDETSVMGILGAIIFIVILIWLWKLV